MIGPNTNLPSSLDLEAISVILDIIGIRIFLLRKTSDKKYINVTINNPTKTKLLEKKYKKGVNDENI
ncbi:MAG TPA: hypothetical protein PKK13_00100 [Spirochaetota bacterium]|nr:hypothetical protein [Spirochaetota bacterium]HQB61423.1 hypothetical protein [Spirochaetota bacterium]